MDRAEAIRRLKANIGAFVFKETNEALDLAIEALGDAESATTTEDCISRQAVTDLLLDAQDGSGQTYEVIRELLHEVAYMPSVPVAETATATDCLSRQQAIEALTGWQTEPLDEDIVRTLESLPPVTPKPY